MCHFFDRELGGSGLESPRVSEERDTHRDATSSSMKGDDSTSEARFEQVANLLNETHSTRGNERSGLPDDELCQGG